MTLPAGLRKLTISDQSLEGLELPSALETLSVSVQSEENNMAEAWYALSTKRNNKRRYFVSPKMYCIYQIVYYVILHCLCFVHLCATACLTIMPVANHSPYMLG